MPASLTALATVLLIIATCVAVGKVVVAVWERKSEK